MSRAPRVSKAPRVTRASRAPTFIVTGSPTLIMMRRISSAEMSSWIAWGYLAGERKVKVEGSPADFVDLSSIAELVGALPQPELAGGAAPASTPVEQPQPEAGFTMAQLDSFRGSWAAALDANSMSPCAALATAINLDEVCVASGVPIAALGDRRQPRRGPGGLPTTVGSWLTGLPRKGPCRS